MDGFELVPFDLGAGDDVSSSVVRAVDPVEVFVCDKKTLDLVIGDSLQDGNEVAESMGAETDQDGREAMQVLVIAFLPPGDCVGEGVFDPRLFTGISPGLRGDNDQPVTFRSGEFLNECAVAV